jgi:prepilin-type N-terminal cleavage/methylation domain-containing protein/prepilin-type processing-associated H-X9-DG protein
MQNSTKQGCIVKHQLLRMVFAVNGGSWEDETRTGITRQGKPGPRDLECSRTEGKKGFTLTELLVVIAIIAVLASLLLPALSSAKEQSKLIKCVSNQKQIGVAFQLYADENDNRFPPLGNNTEYGDQSFEFGGGDPDPNYLNSRIMLVATNRPLWRHAESKRVFECPADRGFDIRPTMPLSKSLFGIWGTSYKYNSYPWTNTRRPMADRIGLAGKRGNWVLAPSQHVLVHDVPALPWQDGDSSWFNSWHYPRGAVTIRVRNDFSKKAIAPVLFVDGHAKSFNFAKHFRDNWNFLAEPTPERIWYKAKE